jgi:hypothetical protein
MKQSLVLVPMHRWPAAHEALSGHRAAFATGASDRERHSVELLTDRAGALVLRAEGIATTRARRRDPWRPVAAPDAGRRRWQRARGPDRDDPLEAAFRAARERVLAERGEP